VALTCCLRMQMETFMWYVKVKSCDSKSGDDIKKSKRPLPYLLFTLQDSVIRADAISLVEHHIRRQAGLQPEDKTRINHILSAVLPRLLNFQPPANVQDAVDSKDNIGKMRVDDN